MGDYWLISSACQVLARDADAQKHLPKVLRDQISAKKGTRSYSTSAILRQQELQQQPPKKGDDVSASGQQQEDPSVSTVAHMIAQATVDAVERQPGLKFEMPDSPLPRTENVRRRYEPLVEQFTKLLMRDGKLSMAQKVCQLALTLSTFASIDVDDRDSRTWPSSSTTSAPLPHPSSTRSAASSHRPPPPNSLSTPSSTSP